MKLTDLNYKLPEFIALEPIKEFGTSANKPILMRCMDKDTGENHEVVVKLIDGERMGDGRSHSCELVGAWLAREMNILVPEPSIVEITEDLADTVMGTYYFRRIRAC